MFVGRASICSWEKRRMPIFEIKLRCTEEEECYALETNWVHKEFDLTLPKEIKNSLNLNGSMLKEQSFMNEVAVCSGTYFLCVYKGAS